MTGDTNPCYAHGKSTSPEWRVWRNMRVRCSDPDHKSYANYGGRGITVCPEWANSFAQFYVDMGPRPAGMSLDRIDNMANYSPDNCRWTTWTVQNNNRRYAWDHPRAKLTEDEVRQMRADYDAGAATFKQLAEQYGVRPNSAWRAVTRRSWAKVV